jgi:hypothetical protein
MNDTAPAPEATIAEAVRRAARRVGLHRLAARAAVPPGMIRAVTGGSLGHDAPALRRLLAEAEAVVAGNQARTHG